MPGIRNMLMNKVWEDCLLGAYMLRRKTDNETLTDKFGKVKE